MRLCQPVHSAPTLPSRAVFKENTSIAHLPQRPVAATAGVAYVTGKQSPLPLYGHRLDMTVMPLVVYRKLPTARVLAGAKISLEGDSRCPTIQIKWAWTEGSWL